MSFNYLGREILTDDEGFLINADDWSPELMNEIARQMNLTLTNEHLTIIKVVRDYYAQYATTPPMRSLIKLLKQQGHANLADSITLASLFPDGAAKSAAKLAGLSKPVHCI
ncbi:MAG: TusE/DsrC/DsvC family sulfur relay protein [Candidatus Anaerobiospirillum merdipullorum]|uniref:Sulfurtransferase n=1 Tax=Candidatus Anaerobiospirillum merdipullorum TaxID=2838450 RepID=A0A9E2KPA4_9GAMM|nr:TusE/DsrC/DsvC family sulfur relay protein [Candidatus Anaerobiospirillum merdipullorum]